LGWCWDGEQHPDQGAQKPLEPISASVLLIGPSDGEFIAVRDRVVDDRSIAHGRSDDPVAPARQSANDLLQA